MTKADTMKLMDLLETLHSDRKLGRDDKTVSTWACVLAPWSYAQVRAAAVKRARKNKYSPSPSELADVLPPLPSPAAAANAQPWMLPYLQKSIGESSAARAGEYHAAGVQTWPEAQSAGVAWLDWLACCRAAFGGRPWPERRAET